MVVNPPARARYMATSLGSITSRIRTSAVTFWKPSLMDSPAIWLWASMSPGVTCFPVPSITKALPRGREIFRAIFFTFPS